MCHWTVPPNHKMHPLVSQKHLSSHAQGASLGVKKTLLVTRWMCHENTSSQGEWCHENTYCHKVNSVTKSTLVTRCIPWCHKNTSCHKVNGGTKTPLVTRWMVSQKHLLSQGASLGVTKTPCHKVNDVTKTPLVTRWMTSQKHLLSQGEFCHKNTSCHKENGVTKTPLVTRWMVSQKHLLSQGASFGVTKTPLVTRSCQLHRVTSGQSN